MCNKLQIPKLLPMQKIIGQHFSAEDFETSVNMIFNFQREFQAVPSSHESNNYW